MVYNKSIYILAILLFCASQLRSESLEVGNHKQHQSLKSAIEVANNGDTILVEPGLYLESGIIVDKSLVIIGTDYPIIDGSNLDELFVITADCVVIEGMQLQNSGSSYTKDLAGIRLVNVRNVTINKNRLYNCFFGIYLMKSSDCTISENQVLGNRDIEISAGNAIHLWYCQNITVFNNHLTGHRDGIYLEFVDQSDISFNISKNNLRYGLHFMFSNNDRYTENTFENNGSGVAVMFSKNITMNKNRFNLNWGSASYGLLLKEIYDGEIIGNEFNKNSIGIFAESANRLKISNNDFKNNGWALKILGSCMDNTFSGNNFFTNTFDLTTNSAKDHNSYAGNYWSSYTGYDLDKNGFGDIPHRPVTMYSYLVGRVDVSILLLRSLFIDILNFTEKVTPMFVPKSLVDPQPLMKPRA
ncbi:MAG: hypothetical protein DHS20C17_33020 [Cyclobacteriaceae bacterium]|nr:MAG: hypothetical protein DHS20C17_33020 [Cyclobacteriaceae bacterium]